MSGQVVDMTQPGSWYDSSKLQRSATLAMPPQMLTESMQAMARGLTSLDCVVIPGARGQKRPKGEWASITQSASACEFHDTDQIGILTGPSVTNPIVTENPKGMAIREVENIGMMIILSNHVDCINVTTTDRRYSFIPTSGAKRGVEHRQWWADIRTRLMTQDTGNHVYTWLLSLTGLPDPTVPLQNSMRRQVQDISKPAHRMFVEERLLAIQDTQWWISKQQLYEEYQQWCRTHGHLSILSAGRFHGKMQELSQGPKEPLAAEVATGEQRRLLSIQPHRKDNRRGYAPRELPNRGAQLVEQVRFPCVNYESF